MNAISITGLVVILALSALFVMRQYVLLVTDWLLKILFVIVVAAGIIGLFWNYPFELGAESLLENMGVKQSLVNTDRQLQKLNPSNWLEGITNFFTQQQNLEEYPEGYLVTDVYPGVLGSVTLILRTTTVIVSILMLLVVIYFSYATYGASKVVHLEHKVHELEKQLLVLQNE